MGKEIESDYFLSDFASGECQFRYLPLSHSTASCLSLGCHLRSATGGVAVSLRVLCCRLILLLLMNVTLDRVIKIKKYDVLRY